jgi:cell division protein FtsB
MQLARHRAKFKYVVLALLAAFLLLNRGARSLVRNSLEYRKLQKQKAALELEKTRLEKDLKAIKAPGNIEKTARKELGMNRPDEIEYRFPPPKKGD